MNSSDEPELATAMPSKDHDQWIKGIAGKFTTLDEIKSWVVVDYAPPCKKDLPSLLSHKIDRDANDKPVRFKGALGILGNLQGFTCD